MLPDWNHRVFKDDSKYRPVGKITAAVAVYLRYAMGDETKDMRLTTVGELYPIRERQVRKVVTGKLYDTEGERVKQIFTNMGRAYMGDLINWNKEAKEAGEIEPENIMYEVTNKEEPDADLPLLQYEPPVMRCRSSMMPPKTLGEHLLEQFEKLEAEELQEVKDIAEMTRMTPKLKSRGKVKKTLPAKVPKILDPEQMETGDIEGPASGQIIPGEASVISDTYIADLSMRRST